MNLHVEPVDSIDGRVLLPSSKSYTIRAFLIAACGGISKLVNPSDSDDCLVAKKVAVALGVSINRTSHNTFVIKADLHKKIPKRINVGESGTVLRFILPLLCLRSADCTVTGEGTLRNRPNTFLIRTLKSMGARIEGRGSTHCVPIRIKKSRLKGGHIEIDGSLSSQFISALLMTCPLVNEDTELSIRGKLVSETYITMTRQILSLAGIKLDARGSQYFFIKGRQIYRGLKNFCVPSDYGLAAFFLAAAALLRSDVELIGDFQDDFIQSDGQILPFLKRMGVRWTKTPKKIRIHGPFQLKGGNFSLRDCPDLVPIMAILALFAQGRTRLLDIGHVRVKESDRIGDLKQELLKVGAKITDHPGALTIEPQPSYRSRVFLNPHHDHRLAMAFSILGIKLAVSIKDIECCSKSYPGFVSDLKKLVGPHALRLKNV